MYASIVHQKFSTSTHELFTYRQEVEHAASLLTETLDEEQASCLFYDQTEKLVSTGFRLLCPSFLSP